MRNPIIKQFTVEGSGEFPIDALRTDECWPATAIDAAHIAANYRMSDADAARRRKVTLATTAKYAPNRQRWSSFGWRVID